MKNIILPLIREQDAQDLAEYSLLIAFVALASAAMFIHADSSMAGIWTTANTILVNANRASS